jgi:HD superfamily phosphohydrolase
LIIQSPPFQRYAAAVGQLYGLVFDLEMIGRLIVGSVEDPDLFYLQEIINGPFDADKMDYFLRDSRFTGIPLAVDIDRLLAFIEVEQLNPAREVEEVTQDPTMETTLRDRNRLEKHLVLGVRGVTAVEQMIFNRFVLTSSIYQHHKVRAADILMVRLATRLKDSGALIQGESLDRVTGFMRVDDGALLRYKGGDELSTEMAHRLRYRRLPKRSLVLSRTTVAEVNSIYHQLGNRSGRSATASATARELTATAIWDVAKAKAPNLPREFVWIDVPKNPEYSDAARCFVRLRRGRYSILSELANMQQMKESFSRSKYRAHVFTVPPFETVVAEAAREVLEDLYEIRILASAFEEAKVSP